MATLVQANPEWKVCIQGSHFQDISQEFRQFERALPYPLRLVNVPFRPQMFANMKNTTSGWGDNIIEAGKVGDEPLIACIGKVTKP